MQLENRGIPLPFSKRLWAAIACMGLGIFCAKAFVINPELYIGLSTVPPATTDYLWSFVAIVFAALFYHVLARRRYMPRAGEWIFGFCFGFANYFGTTLFAYDSWAFVNTALPLVNVVFKCLGQALVMVAALSWITAGLNARDCSTVSARPPRFLARCAGFYRARTTLCCSLLLLLCWLPYLLFFYPGTVIWDLSEMAAQFFGLAEMTAWHSVFTTWVFGGLVWLGRQLGSDNIGICLYMLGQSVLLAYALGRSVAYIRRCGISWLWQAAALAFFGLIPFWGSYAQLVGKDTVYTATLLLFTLQTLTLAESRDGAPRPRSLAAYGITALLCCLWRNNGLYVVLPTALCAVLFLVRGWQRLRVGAPLAAAVLAAFLFNQALVPALGIADNTASGVYSVCFQQTARTVRDHGAELTQRERTEIDHILDLDSIGRIYEPWISDPVKHTFRQFGQGAEVEKEALARYREIWLSMLKKYPVSYLQAFMANNSGYYAFTPMYIGLTFNQQPGMRHQLFAFSLEGEGQLNPIQPEAFAPARRLITAVADRMRTLPVLSWLYLCPVYTWLLVAAGIALAHRRRWRDLACFLPALMSFAVCLLSPVNDYFRYFLPIIAMTPALTAFARRGA